MLLKKKSLNLFYRKNKIEKTKYPPQYFSLNFHQNQFIKPLVQLFFQNIPSIIHQAFCPFFHILRHQHQEVGIGRKRFWAATQTFLRFFFQSPFIPFKADSHVLKYAIDFYGLVQYFFIGAVVKVF